MKIQDLVGNEYFKSLAAINKLSSSRIARKEPKTVAKLFSLVTSTVNLCKEVKKSDIEDKDVILSNLVKIANTVNGLLESPTLEREEVKAHIKKMKKRSSEVSNVVLSNLRTLVDNKVYAISFDDLEKVKSNLQDDDKQEIEKVLDANESIIRNLQKHSNSLPNTTGNPASFTLARVPVVAISPLSQKDFSIGGFVVSPLGQYSVLNDQLVIGINPEKIDKDTTLDKYLNMVVKSLENQQGQKFFIMTNPKPYRNSGFIYYWVIEEKLINRVRSNTGKNFLVNKWGFAFK